MKKLVSAVLANSRSAQERWMKLATYPRFAAWVAAHPAPAHIPGGQRAKRNNLFEIVAEAENLANEEIFYAEFGVHEGVSIAWWADKNTQPASVFLGFDSFEGLPEDWLDERGKGAFSTGGQTPQTDDPRVRFVAGWFHESLPGELPAFATSARKVIHMDGDLYRSTIYPLMVIGPHLNVGDILIFDEFSDSIHEFRAFEDFQVIFSYEFELLGATPGHTQVAVKRTA